MAEMIYKHIYKTDITKPLIRRDVGALLGMYDSKANRFGVELYDNGTALDVTGKTVTGYVIRPNAQTVMISGKTSKNLAYVDLNANCYYYDGAFTLSLKVGTQTMLICDGQIAVTRTGEVVDEERVIPSLEEIAEAMEAVETATANANTATSNAKTATSSANSAATKANNAASTANTAAANANTATTAANTAADRANAAAESYENLGANLDLYSEPTQFGATSASTPMEFHTKLPAGSIYLGAAGSLTDAGWNFPTTTATLEVLKHNNVRSRYMLYAKTGASYWSEVDDNSGYPTCVWHKFYDDKSTVPIENGGTGATTAKGAEYAISGNMSSAVSSMSDESTFVCKRTTPSASDGVFVYRPLTQLWTYIAGKIRSVFGFTSSNVLPIANGGTEATTAADARTKLGITPANIGAAASSHTHNYAGSSSAGGAATSANKLNTNAGDANTPVYFESGVPKACTGLKCVTLWSGTAADGATITFSESLNNFSQVAVRLNYVPSDVIGWTSGTALGMFMRMAYNDNGDQTLYSARLDVADGALSATVASPQYVSHPATATAGKTGTCSVRAVYGWR